MNRRKLQAQILNCNPNFKKFFAFALDYLDTHDKELVIHSTEKIKYQNDSGECTGWCDGDSIEVARRLHLFEETFAHEFCHMTQAVEQTVLWNNHQTSTFWEDLVLNNTDALSLWNEMYKTIKLEQNCEARVLKLNKQWQLFDPILYAKQANAHLHFYHYVYLTRNWDCVGDLYCDELLSCMPSKLCSPQNLKHINMNIMNTYSKILKQCV